MIVLTHGHGDHVGDTVALASSSAAPSSRRSSCAAGSRRRASTRTWPHAPQQGRHGRRRRRQGHAHRREPFERATTARYLGESCGLVIELEDGTKLYFAGDTNVFGDMAADRAHLRAGRRRAADRRPLHDGPARGRGRARAARREALRALPLRHVPAAHGHARSSCVSSRPDVEIVAPEPGEIGRAVRERWFGATGRRVPELALEGDARRRGRARARRRRRRRRAARGARAGDAGRRARGDARGGAGGARAARGRLACSSPTDDAARRST